MTGDRIDNASPPGRERGACALLLAGVGLLVLLVAVAVYTGRRFDTPPVVGPSVNLAGRHGSPAFVGSEACAACHARQYRDWLGSHHQLAMQAATPASVLGDFDGVRLAAGDGAVFSRHDNTFMVQTTGPDGRPHDYPIRYTFGVFPLQQYLIALPGGRLQAFGAAWDSRAKQDGGQRWFALYPESKGKATSPFHWTAIDQNWNGACSHCHSTGVRKGYDPTTHRYHTTFSEVSVGCEACHGPGAAHVAWARDPRAHPNMGPHHGLMLDFGADALGNWHYEAASGEVVGHGARAGRLEVETCARCHARGTPIHEAVAHGQPVADDIRVALLDPALYYPDGQIKGEVFEYGSFIQSRMFHAGVTCSNCHDPHTDRLRSQGNGLCTQCHQAERYDTPAHYHHPAGSPGSRCVACHMPTRTYMKVDVRHDHSLRVPRPDLSASLGTPNACNQCHRDKDPAWAADAIRRWHHGAAYLGLQRFGPALWAGREGAPGARSALERLVGDSGQPAIARATALSLLVDATDGGDQTVFRRAAGDPSPLVRRAAAAAPGAALGLLDDPRRSVRIEAAQTLAGYAAPPSPPSVRRRLEAASVQYRGARALNADRPEAHLGLAGFYAARGDSERALKELHEALSLDPAFIPAAINLADFYRARGDDDRAASVLRRILVHAPGAAAPYYALGLLDVRAGQRRKALADLAAAERLAPNNAQYAYVYALELNAADDTPAAIRVLEASLRRHPYHRPSLTVLAELYRRQGKTAQAEIYEERLRRWRQAAETGKATTKGTP